LIWLLESYLSWIYLALLFGRSLILLISKMPSGFCRLNIGYFCWKL
jgi:hypothetical protein